MFYKRYKEMIKMNDKKRTVCLILSWGFTIVCMIIIFLFSGETAEVSSSQSGGLIRRILDTFGIELSQHFIRKTAHALEFCGLCLAFNLAYGFTFLKHCPLISLSSTVFYAATDEIHQYFIDGRACQLRDVFVDFCGALAAVVFCAVVYYIYIKITDKREEKICQY